MAKVAATLIHKITGKIVIEDEVGYIALSLQLLLEGINKKKRGKYILLVCPFGQTSANLFKYKYLEVFSDQIESIETSSVEGVKKYDLNRFDYIFTLAPLEIKTSVPILNANCFLNETTINDIKNRLKTDNKGFFAYSLESLSKYWYTFNKVSLDLHHDERNIENIMTNYEKQYLKEGRPIYYLDASSDC